MYEIFTHNRTCKKRPLKVEFQPMGIPDGSSLLGQVVLGSSSGPLEGLLVNTWMADMPHGGMRGHNGSNCYHYFLMVCCFINSLIFISFSPGKFIFTVTEFECIPVTTLQQTDQFGWVMSR